MPRRRDGPQPSARVCRSTINDVKNLLQKDLLTIEQNTLCLILTGCRTPHIARRHCSRASDASRARSRRQGLAWQKWPKVSALQAMAADDMPPGAARASITRAGEVKRIWRPGGAAGFRSRTRCRTAVDAPQQVPRELAPHSGHEAPVWPKTVTRALRCPLPYRCRRATPDPRTKTIGQRDGVPPHVRLDELATCMKKCDYFK